MPIRISLQNYYPGDSKSVHQKSGAIVTGELTLLPGTRIPELLDATSNLFGSPAFARGLKDVVGYELVPHREASQGPR